MSTRALFLLLSLIITPLPAWAGAPARPELELKRLLFATAPYEISGMTKVGNTLLAVTDGADDQAVYEVVLGERDFYMKPFVEFKTLAGYPAYLAAQADESHVPVKDRRFDLEGITACKDRLYLVNERVRHVLMIHDRKTLEKVPLDLAAYPDLFAGEPNAGFEGIAIDCRRQRLYIAKERAPRAILEADLGSGKLLAFHDIPVSDRAGQKVIEYKTGAGLMTLTPDFADLAFDGGYLYAIERNTYEIAKIDPDSWTVVARVSYFRTERPLYETGEPFGLAEALVLTPSEIIIGLDHNATPFSATSRDRYGVRGNGATIMVFDRPKGF